MSDVLPIFDAEGNCPKCGQEGLVRTEESVFVGVTTHYCARPQYGDPCFTKTLGEHLHRKCKRCSFTWCEAVLPDGHLEVTQIVRRKPSEPEFQI